MSSTALRALAVSLIGVAALLAIYAFRIGGEEPSPPADAPLAAAEAAAAEPSAQAVVALRTIERGMLLNREAVELRAVEEIPEGGFARVEDVVGRVAALSVPAGEALLARHFREPGPLAQALQPGERAVAVKIDGVIGLGGFAQPGDRVDVILYLSSNSRDVPQSQAQLLLEDVRILAYGTRIESDPKGKPATDARTAVLAVPLASVSQLMLGASAGSLRLALRGEGGEPSAAAALKPVKLKTLVATAKRSSRPARPTAEIIRGSEREVVRP